MVICTQPQCQTTAGCKCDAARTPEFQRLHVQLCRIAAIEMDWLQRLISGDDAMREIGKIFNGK